MKIDLRHIKKLLIIRLRFIGDVVLATSLIEAIKKQYPGVAVSFMGEADSVKVLDENPYLEEIIVIKKSGLVQDVKTLNKIRKNRFDIVIDMFGNPRSALITRASLAPVRIGWAQRGRKYAYNMFLKHKIKDPDALSIYGDAAKLLGLKSFIGQTKIYLSKEEKKFGPVFIKSKGLNLKNKLIGIHPGASWPAKIWLEENFAKIADRLISEGKQVLLFGGPKDRTAVAKVSMFMKNKPVLADNLPLREFMAVLTNCSCFVTNDNGPMHISVAMGVPTLGIFGSSNPAIWFPYKGQKAAYLKKYPECWPCSKDQCKDLRCMKMIKPDEVYKAIKKLCK